MKSLLSQNVDPEKQMAMMTSMALALFRSHSVRVWHGDIKPDNIFLDSSTEIIKLGDFGKSMLADKTAESASNVGAEAYRAPEVVGSWKSS